MKGIWLRHEIKPFEKRTALTPQGVKDLISQGIEVVVERSSERIFPDSDYQELGCSLVEAGSWTEAPQDFYILGLKELPSAPKELAHKHIYFAHAYKGQDEAQSILQRFRSGGGQIFDLEYLTDTTHKRVVAFGHFAGYAGAAVGLHLLAKKKFELSSSYQSKEELKQAVSVKEPPKVMVIGAKGRSGHGAVEFFNEMGIPVTQWDTDQTKAGGPFSAIMDHHLLINCALVTKKIPPFLTPQCLKKNKNLQVICDVSCDPGPLNPLPFYERAHTFSDPYEQKDGLLVSAIDHLPTLVPRESSEEFSHKLTPLLISLLKEGPTGPWQNSFHHFQKNI